jgi:hypothetical protein
MTWLTVMELNVKKDREVFATSGTYPWSFVTQIFHNGQPSHGQAELNEIKNNENNEIFEVPGLNILHILLRNLN